MTGPTVLSPWYVVQRQSKDLDTEYYRHVDDLADPAFTGKKAFAMHFTNLNSAARIAAATHAEIRVLVSREDAKEFGR